MSTIPPVGSFTPTTTTGSTATSGSTAGDNGMGQDTFMKLLVAQLKYQDPSKPTDSSQFMAQTAQFTLVEKMGALLESQQEVASSSRLASATGLVGSTVTYLANGRTSAGVVTGVSISDGVPTLLLGETRVDLSQVSKVEAAQPAG